jgi:hypothetical protein
MTPRRLAALLCTLAACLLSPRAHAADPAAAAPVAAAPGNLRPQEAPLLGTTTLPPLPPEYLTQEQAGIRFAYHPSARGRVRALLEDCESVRAELDAALGRPVLAHIEIRVAMGGGDFARILPQGAPQAPVVALSEVGLVALSLRAGAASAADVRYAFRRGLAYLALDEATATATLPRWLRVGFALAFSEESELERAHALWWASMQQHLLPMSELDWYLSDGTGYDGVAAAQAADFVTYLMARERAGAFARLVSAAREAPTFEAALASAYQEDLSLLEHDWRDAMARRRGFVPILAGGTLLWLAVALASALRRRRRAAAKSERRRERPPPAPRPATDRPRRLPPPPPPRTPHPEAEVPKVSHEGRWHTLH